MKTMSKPEYVVFTYSELELGRRYYFEQKCTRTEHIKPLYKELFCQLMRNTKTNMTTRARATEDAGYSSTHKVNTIAKQLVE